jgi:hypothetical protein
MQKKEGCVHPISHHHGQKVKKKEKCIDVLLLPAPPSPRAPNFAGECARILLKINFYSVDFIFIKI